MPTDFETRIAQEMLDAHERRTREGLLGASACSAFASTTASITLEDIREAVLSIPHLPKHSWARVSDGWWVCMEDGKPTGILPHGDLMKTIQEVCRPNAPAHRQPPGE